MTKDLFNVLTFVRMVVSEKRLYRGQLVPGLLVTNIRTLEVVRFRWL